MIRELGIPAQVRERLDELVASLRATLVDELVAVVVYGSAARGEWRQGSDVDLIVVVGVASRDQLAAMGDALELARSSARIEAMILERAEIPRAADVFPLLYRDVARHHVVVHGGDPFAGLEIHQEHLRLRIEQELRDAQIRLRRAATDARGSRKALQGAVTRKLRQLRAPLHALLEREGDSCDDRLRTVFEYAARRYGVTPEKLHAAQDDPEAAHDALVALLRKAIDAADRIEG